MFEKVFELSLNKDYVSHWGFVEAVREIVQNALDSDSPFVYEFLKIGDNNYTLVLVSENATLTPQSLLLGTTSKSDATDKIGSFGEGYKIALLVLTRLGIPVRLINGSKVWTPSFRYNSRFEQDLLAITETAAPVKRSGVVYEIGSLTDDMCADVVASCLRMQNDIGAVKSTPYGKILLEQPGKLYVGGLYICSTSLKYGYDIHPSKIRLERDRQTVSSWDLESMTTAMWFATEEYDKVANMIKDEIPDISNAEYSSPQMVKEACYQLFKWENPGAVVARSQTELKELVAKGMTKVVTVGGAYYNNVSNASSYKSATYVPVVLPHVTMTKWLSDNRGEMRTGAIVAFKKLIEESKTWQL